MNGVLLKGGHVVRKAQGQAERLDVSIGADGRIARMGVDLQANGSVVIHLDGQLITPAFVDMHQHLDKSLSIDEAPNPEGTLIGAAEAIMRYAGTLSSESIDRRARRTLDMCIGHGTAAIRSHTNVDYEMQMRGVEALLALQEEYRDSIHLDVVAFMSSSAARGDVQGARKLLESALDAGANTIGGAPNFSPDPPAFIDMLLEVGMRRGCLIDLHVDETLNPEARWLAYLARRAAQLGMGDRVVAGHCSSLYAMEADDAARVMDLIQESGMGIVTLPAANLFLQARSDTRLPARGLTRVVELLARGVPVVSASDNIQDAFVPVGTGDMLEAARWTILAAHLLKDAPRRAFEMISATPARLMHLEPTELEPGRWANMVIAPAASLEDLVRSGTRPRSVFHRGRCVAGPLQQENRRGAIAAAV